MLFVLIALLVIASGCADPGDANHSVAYKLAVIDGEVPFDEDSEEVRPYKRQMLLLTERCTNTAEHLADYAVAIQGTLKDKFVDVTTLEIMRLVNVGLEGSEAQDCKLAFATAGVVLESTN